MEDNDIAKFGRRLPRISGKQRPGAVMRRIHVLHETLEALSNQEKRQKRRDVAMQNLQTWREKFASTKHREFNEIVVVRKGDWGEVTQTLTRQYGTIFAVLNMANAEVAGGGYVEGCPAQEENMYRRTDCHFYINASEFDQAKDRYHPEMTELLNAADGKVFLDTKDPRVCIRGPELSDHPELGYEWLGEGTSFPFYELRSSALDLRLKMIKFDFEEVLRRVHAQLDTLISNNVRHVVLSAFGCGAFLNPADKVARAYRKALEEKYQHFDCVAFAIYYPGYGADNFVPFNAVLSAPFPATPKYCKSLVCWQRPCGCHDEEECPRTEPSKEQKA